MATRVLLALLIGLLLAHSSYAQDEVRPDLKTYFDEYRVSGGFVMYDRNAGKWTRYNPDVTKKAFSPGSTFDIVTTLAGFETGTIPDAGFVFKWNGEKRALNAWERDLTLAQAFQASCVPCFREVARSIGSERMADFLEKLRYGNASVAGDPGAYWLTGGTRISADEQVRLLMSLYEEKLPLSPHSIRAVKTIMLRDDTPRYKLFGKTGWLTGSFADPIGKPSLGWFVGYQERAGNVYFFATVIETENTQADFASARVDIAKRILKQLCVLE